MWINTFIITILALLPICIAAQSLPDLPDCYHNYDEITTILLDLEDQHSDIAKVHMIGYSQQDELPIYAMQISADVEGDWERPALLFVGQVHAEEVLGVEITLSNIQEILQRRNQFPYSMWINQLESWWVPTLNPEGHNVVTTNLDTSFRKNKRDNNENGIFDFLPQVGGDIDGVDINRNFDFNFTHGDTLYQPATPSHPEAYDYYRGPAPYSESETQAIKALSDEKKFVYSICWHSSRSGNFSEKVYYSFNWKGVRPSPDLALAHSIGQGVAAQILKEDGTPYEFYPNASRRGAFHDWMYKEYSTMQLLIEVGTRNLQPQEALMLDTIQRATNGVWWMMNRALSFSSAVPSNSLLTGHTTDSSTGAPISAEIIVQERHAPWFVPRMSDPDTGRFFRPLAMGSYTIQARKKGYWDTVMPAVNVHNSSWTMISVELQPKAAATLSGVVRSGGQLIPARIIIEDIEPDTLFVNGQYVYHGYEGEYPIQIYADGYYPYLGTIELGPGTNHAHYNLSPANVIFSEDWEEDTSAWELVGVDDPPDGLSIWPRIQDLSDTGYAITDSWGGRGHYLQNCDVWIKTEAPISLPDDSSPLLYFDSHLYTEWTHDPVTVEVSVDGDVWTEVFRKSGRHDWWQKEYVPLNDFAGQSVYLRFRLRDESTGDDLTDPGWTLDNIFVVSGDAVSVEDGLSPELVSAALHPNYPNPFNPETNISYSLASPQEVSIEIYNLKGQRVASHQPGMQPAGTHHFVWKGCDDRGHAVASGVYFYRMKAGDFQKSMKMVLMK